MVGKYINSYFFESNNKTEYYYSQKGNCFCWHPFTLGKESLPTQAWGRFPSVDMIVIVAKFVSIRHARVVIMTLANATFVF